MTYSYELDNPYNSIVNRNPIGTPILGTSSNGVPQEYSYKFSPSSIFNNNYQTLTLNNAAMQRYGNYQNFGFDSGVDNVISIYDYYNPSVSALSKGLPEENKPITLAETPSVASEGEEESTTFAQEVTGAAATGAFMSAPHLFTLKESLAACPKVTKDLETVVRSSETISQATNTAKTVSSLHNSYRFEKSIRSVPRASEETSKIMEKLGSLRSELVAARKANDTVEIAKKVAEIEKLTSLTKKPNVFSRLWSFVFGSKEKEIAKIFEETAKAGAEAATKAEKVEKAVEAVANGSNLTKCFSWLKSAGKAAGFWFMLACESFLELEAVCSAFFKGGCWEGLKQTAKSVINVGASVGGWCVGFKAGAGIGAAIGSFICPGIGTAIGGFIGGIAGGTIASWGSKKVAKAVTGKSYS